MLSLIGLAATTVGALGYSFDVEGLESDVDVLKITAVFYMLVSVEFLAHHILMNDRYYHMIVHFILSLTAFLIGVYTLSIVRRYPHDFVTSRFKDVLIYGALIWLLDKNLNLSNYIDLASFTLMFFSFLVALLSAYMFYTIKKLRTFFLVDRELISATSLVVYMIGLSTLCMCVFPLVIAALIVVYKTAKVIVAIRPFIGL